jgi:hypothetical protein
MTQTIARTYEHFSFSKTYATYALSGICLLFAMTYVFNMYRVISYSVALQNVEVNIVSVQNDVQELDTRYISLSNRITPDLVRSRGMKEGVVTNYISRNSSLGMVSLSGYGL